MDAFSEPAVHVGMEEIMTAGICAGDAHQRRTMKRIDGQQGLDVAVIHELAYDLLTDRMISLFVLL